MQVSPYAIANAAGPRLVLISFRFNVQDIHGGPAVTGVGELDRGRTATALAASTDGGYRHTS